MASRSVGLAMRWVARGWSLLSIIFVLIFVAAQGLGSHVTGPSAQDWVSLALFPIGVCFGLALAWYREGVGGFLALGCFLAFYAWNLLRSGYLPSGPFFLLVSAPSLLFIGARFQYQR